MTDMDIFGIILDIFVFSGLLYVIYEIKKRGLKFRHLDKPIIEGKSSLDVALREFARQVVRELLITLRVVKKNDYLLNKNKRQRGSNQFKLGYVHGKTRKWRN